MVQGFADDTAPINIYSIESDELTKICEDKTGFKIGDTVCIPARSYGNTVHTAQMVPGKLVRFSKDWGENVATVEVGHRKEFVHPGHLFDPEIILKLIKDKLTA